jgi:chemotaxis protein methyltransferase CheR
LRFKDFINNRTGLYFKDYDLKDLDGVISDRMKACSFDTILAYYTYLTSSKKTDDELRELLNRLTINHTYFFRNEPQFKALKEKILPELIERKKKMGQSPSAFARASADRLGTVPIFSLRIWSAGCSTGEEPYTIAMIIKDIIPDIENWDIQILATDASTEALEAARKGIYNVNSVRLVDDYHKNRYFAEKAGAGPDAKYAIRDEIKRMVNFSFFNLMEEDYPKGFDILFCRNVTIYFELETTIRVIKNLAESLDDNGYLFIGYSETLQFISDKFKMINWQDAIFYLKTKTDIAHKRFVTPRPMPIELKVDAILEEISKEEFEAESKEGTKKKRSLEFGDRIVRAMKAIHTKNYEGALSLTEEARLLEKNAPDPYYIAAEVYANQGKFKDAKDNLYAALSKDMMFAPAHHLFGSIYAEEGKTDAAEESYRRALYLENGFSIAHFSLANIYKNKNRIDDALREYRNTLSILSRSHPYDIVAYSGGFNTAALAGVCKDNIERLKTAEQ